MGDGGKSSQAGRLACPRAEAAGSGNLVLYINGQWGVTVTSISTMSGSPGLTDAFALSTGSGVGVAVAVVWTAGTTGFVGEEGGGVSGPLHAASSSKLEPKRMIQRDVIGIGELR